LLADGSYSKYRGVTDQFTEEYFLLNASIGKKIFRNQRGEINVTVNDILNQNKSFVRNVSENYIQNVTSNVLGRYVCINFVFNLRKFKGKDGESYDQPQRSGHGEGRPAGAPPMGGPGEGGPDGPRGGGMPMMPMGGGGGPVGGF
ncbi:MAG: outer membrane beta-barrel protein, partial [Alistipes sp.]|nr:outer membrane beta-barrel protein [Alistipes sp.]